MLPVCLRRIVGESEGLHELSELLSSEMKGVELCWEYNHYFPHTHVIYVTHIPFQYWYYVYKC